MGTIDFAPLWITLKTGIVASVFSFFIGIAFAELVINTKGRVRAFWDGLLTLPMVLPPTVAGYILLRIFSTRSPFGSFLSNSMGIQVVHTWLGCVVAATIIALPLMYRNARAAFEQIDENVIYAARTLGISEWKVFWKIRLPMAKPGIISGVTLAFARAIGEYGATSMLAGNIAGKTSTISQQIAMVIQSGDYATAGFWCIVIIAISFACLVSINMICGKSKGIKRKRKNNVAHSKNKKQLDNFMLSVDMELTDEIVSVIGMSGSGKSMTLKCIAGIETPDSGFISLNDRVLYDSKNRINLHPGKRRVGYLFQDYALFPTMTVMENICIAMGHRDEKKVKVWLKRYGLDGMADTYPDHLSGGQRQRVAMLRMLAAKPECILLDEPFSALDEHVKRSMESELMEMLSDFHNPVIFVSHNRDEVYRLAERIGSIESGMLSAVRDKKDFFMRPMSVEQALLVGCNNISQVKWQDKHHVLAVEWDSVFEVTDEQIEQLAMDTDNISHIGVFPQDIVISASKAKSVLAYNNKNIIRIKDYKIVEELKTWEVSCELNNDSTIYANLPKHTEANMLSKNINDELYIKKFYLLG